MCAATALPGVFLVLRGMALMSDAISHAIVPGIVCMFFITHTLDSPLLLLGAALAGLLTVITTQAIINTQRLYQDAAIGVVFPLFFSVGVILISRYARNVHLDTDMVLLGELAFAPFNYISLFGYTCGSYALVSMTSILLLNSCFIFFFLKELKCSTFDRQLSQTMGFSPAFMHYGLMAITSITTVAAFDIVGSLVVVALMITPAASAYLLAHRVEDMIILAIAIGAAASSVGYLCAFYADVSVAGSLACIQGIIFLCTLLFSKNKGIIAHITQRNTQHMKLACTILNNYCKEYPQATTTQTAHDLNWSPSYLKKVYNHKLQNY